MYHGSKTLITNGHLEPRQSYYPEKLVFSTDDYFYALVRCGRFDMKEASIREDYRGKELPYQLAELYSGAFQDVFNHPGYIYLVEDKYFTKSPDESEYISKSNVPIAKIIFIDNVWNEIVKNRNKYELIFDGDIEFWKNIKGGKAGYIERRKQRYLNRG